MPSTTKKGFTPSCMLKAPPVVSWGGSSLPTVVPGGRSLPEPSRHIPTTNNEEEFALANKDVTGAIPAGAYFCKQGLYEKGQET